MEVLDNLIPGLVDKLTFQLDLQARSWFDPSPVGTATLRNGAVEDRLAVTPWSA